MLGFPMNIFLNGMLFICYSSSTKTSIYYYCQDCQKALYEKIK